MSAGNILEFKVSKDYEVNAHNYTLVIELQGTDKRIQTLTVSLTNVNDIESKLKQTSFSVSESTTTTISNLSSHLLSDELDEISYKILSKFNGGSLFQTNVAGNTVRVSRFLKIMIVMLLIIL